MPANSIVAARQKAQGTRRKRASDRACRTRNVIFTSSFLLPPSSLQFQEPGGVAPEYPAALGFRELPEAFDYIHRPRIAHIRRAVTAHHPAIRPDLADEIHEYAVAMRDRVVMKAAQVARGGLGHVFAFLPHRRPVIHAADQRRKYATGVRQHHVELGECIHYSAEHQRGGRNTGLKGIAEKIAQMILARALAPGWSHRVQENR